MLDWKHKLLMGILIVFILGGVLGFRTWLSEHDARIETQASAKAQDAVRAGLQQQMDALQKQAADREIELQATLKRVDTKFSEAGTPDQLAQLVSQLMGVKQPIPLVTPAASDGNARPGPVAQVPQIDFPQVKAYFQECELCKAERAKLQADATDRESQAKLAQQEIDSLKKENGNLRTAANGGTWWLRTKRAAKWLTIGGVVGAAALCSTGHCKL